MRVLILMILTLLPFVWRVEAFPTNVVTFSAKTGFKGLGNLSKAESEYFIPSSYGMSSQVYQLGPDGETATAALRSDWSIVTPDPKTGKDIYDNKSREMVDNRFKILLSELFRNVLTNKSFKKDLPVYIHGRTTRTSFSLGIIVWVLETDTSIQIKKDANGHYLMPDLSTQSLGVSGSMYYEVPGLKRAWIKGKRKVEKITALSKTAEYVDFEIDSETDPDSSVIDIEHGMIILPTDWVVNGLISQISIITGPKDTLQIYGSAGTPILGEDTRIVNTSAAVFQITGEKGRKVLIQTADTVTGPWTDTDIEIVLPSYPVPLPIENPTGFFRTRTVDF